MKQALIKLHMAILLAGFTGVLGRLITLNEGLLVWYRLGITILAMLLLSLFRHNLPKVGQKEMGRLAAVGFLIALHWLCFYGSIKSSNVSIALVCFSSSSFFSAVTEPLLYRKRADITEVLLSLVGIGGIYIILHFDRRFTSGILLGLAAAFLSALFTILNKKLTETHSPATLTFYELGAGFLFLSLLMPFYLHAFPSSRLLPTAKDWMYLLILSLACTIWAFELSLSAMKKVSSFTTNLSYNLEPVYGILLAFLIFKENKSFNNQFYIGVLLIFLSVILQSRRMIRLHKAEG